ncbi:hypothetical protein CP061683_0532B, partial [Chlamydia psittaci 06-1683]
DLMHYEDMSTQFEKTLS